MKIYAKRKLAALALILATAGTIAAALMIKPSDKPGRAEEGKENEQPVELKPSEETIYLPGIEGEYDFLFLTDSHIVVTDSAESPQVRDHAGERLSLFGREAAENFSGWMEYAQERKLDGILLGGDIVDFPSSANLNFLDALLSRSGLPFLYTPGNHDWTYPWEYMTDAGRQSLLPLLVPYMEGNTDFHVLDCGEFLIAAADNSSGQFTEAAVRGLENISGESRPVILLVHVPLLTQSVLTEARRVWDSGVVLGGGNYGGIYPNETSERALELITARDSPVKAVLAGHVHFFDKGLVEPAGENTGLVQIVGEAGYKGAGMVLHIRGEAG